MTTFNPIVLKCPQCGALMSDFELMSFTVHHATSWSDGKSDEVFLNSNQIKICTVCHLPFWIEDAKLPDDPDWDVADELSGPLDLNDLPWRFDEDRKDKTIAFYKDLLDDGFAYDDSCEAYLRTRIWWSINDLIRYLPSWTRIRNFGQISKIFNIRRSSLAQFRKYEELQTTNLKQLIFLYIKANQIDLPYLANMYRESGNFEKAIDILGKIKEDKGKTYRMIRSRTRAKDRKVFLVSS